MCHGKGRGLLLTAGHCLAHGLPCVMEKARFLRRTSSLHIEDSSGEGAACSWLVSLRTHGFVYHVERLCGVRTGDRWRDLLVFEVAGGFP